MMSVQHNDRGPPPKALAILLLCMWPAVCRAARVPCVPEIGRLSQKLLSLAQLPARPASKQTSKQASSTYVLLLWQYSPGPGPSPRDRAYRSTAGRA